MFYRISVTIFLVLSLTTLQAQDAGENNLDTYLEQLNLAVSKVSQKLNKLYMSALARVQKIEQKVNADLQKSKSATQLFHPNLSPNKLPIQGNGPIFYYGSLDTLFSSLKFLSQDQSWMNTIKNDPLKLSLILEGVSRLKENFSKAAEIKGWLEEMRLSLKAQIQGGSIVNKLKELAKQIDIYSSRFNRIQSMLNYHCKTANRLLDLVGRNSAFKGFMQKNSLLACLFELPGDVETIPTINAVRLQTRDETSRLIQQRILPAGPQSTMQIQDALQTAQTKLNDVKEKVKELGTVNSGFASSSSSAGSQNVQPGKKKLDPGVSVEVRRSTVLFPVMTNLGISLGYRLNNKSILGVAMCGDIGWGMGWNNLQISSQGLDFRGFLECKLRGGLWIAASYENSYSTRLKELSLQQGLNQIGHSPWRQSGLLGISKVIEAKGRLIKRTKLQLLWDPLSHRRLSRTESIFLRTGYSLN